MTAAGYMDPLDLIWRSTNRVDADPQALGGTGADRSGPR